MTSDNFLEWGRIADTMRLLAQGGDSSFDEASLINNEDNALKVKKLAIIAILDSLCSMIK